MDTKSFKVVYISVVCILEVVFLFTFMENLPFSFMLSWFGLAVVPLTIVGVVHYYAHMEKPLFIRNSFCRMIFKLLFSSICVIGDSISSGKTFFSLLNLINLVGLFFFIDSIAGLFQLFYRYISKTAAYKLFNDIRFNYIRTLLTIFLVNTVAATICFPGLMLYDTRTQIRMALGLMTVTDHHPVLLTYVLKLFISVGNHFGNVNIGMFSLVLIQAFLMAVSSAYAIRLIYLITQNGVLTNVTWLFYAINPLYVVYTVTLGKDSIVAFFLLFYCCSIVDTVYVTKRIDRRLFFQLLISAVLASLIRHNAFYIFVISIPLLYLAVRQFKAIFLCFLLFFISVSGVHLLYHQVLGIERSSDAEKYSVLMQTTARLLKGHRNELSEDELYVISTFMGNADDILSRYNPQFSDPLKNYLYNKSITDMQKKAFFSQWFRLFFRYPKSYFTAILHHTYGYFYIDYNDDVKPRFWVKQTIEYYNTLNEYGFSVGDKQRIKRFEERIDDWGSRPVIGLIIRIGTYSWILLYCLFNALATKDRSYLIICTPVFLYLCTVLLGPVNGYYRYMIPVALCAPFLMLVKKRP